MVFTAEQIEEIKSKAVAATEKLRSEFLPVEEYEKKRKDDLAAAALAREKNPASKEVRVAEAIKKIPICDDGKKAVAELVKAITGLAISLPECIEELNRQHIPFSIMVPTKNENSHNYSLNMPAMMVYGIKAEGSDPDNAIQINGQAGNHLQWGGSGLRPATDDEIDMFFKAWVVLSEIGVPLCDGYDLFKDDDKEENEGDAK